MIKSKQKISLLVFILLMLFLILAAIRCSRHLKTNDELLNFKNAEASLVTAEDGELLGKFYLENRTNIPFNQFPSSLINALIATEDARFYEHKGFDTRSFFRVLAKTIILSKRKSGGGSTITQQLAKNILGRESKGMFHTLSNKFREIIMAHRIERLFSKEEILTLYLNTVSFGENVYGIEAASTRFFNKSTKSLRIEESALLVGILKANTYYNPHLHPDNSKTRRNVVLNQMVKYNYLKKSESDSLSNLPLKLDYNPETAGPADYFLVQVKKEIQGILNNVYNKTGKRWNPEKDGLIISSTLNLKLQKYGTEAFSEHLPGMQKKLSEQYINPAGRNILEQIKRKELARLNFSGRAGEKRYQEIFDWKGNYNDTITVGDSLEKALTLLHAGMLAMDPVTGEIKAWIGGIDFKTQPYDQIMARRQLASVFKPVLYTVALEEGMEPCQYLDNDSVRLSDFEDWSPENYDHSYGGKYSLSGALAQSMNIPTFSLFLEIGFAKVDSMWKKMGFSYDLVNAPSLALGTAEASIKEVAVAYSAFANGGYHIEPYCVFSIKTPQGEVLYSRENTSEKTMIINERSSLLMNAMLQKALKEGTGVSMGSVYGVDLPLAGKTGTSQDYSDAWFAAYNPKLIIVSRSGASLQAIHFNNGRSGSGSALALPLVALTFKGLQEDTELKNRFIADFPELPRELKGALDCPDFKDKNLFDRIIDIFEKDTKTYDKGGTEKKNKLRSFLRKIFKK